MSSEVEVRRSESGIDPETGEWTPAFEGQRPPFEPGNQLSVGNRGGLTHTAYSTLRVSARTREIADLLAGELPGVSPMVLDMAAMSMARAEAADRAIGEIDAAILKGGSTEISAWLGNGAPPLERLRQDMKGWQREARNWFAELGMTSASQARIQGALADRSTTVTVNTLVASPEWVGIRARIIGALEPYPDAHEAVVAAIADGEAS